MCRVVNLWNEPVEAEEVGMPEHILTPEAWWQVVDCVWDSIEVAARREGIPLDQKVYYGLNINGTQYGIGVPGKKLGDYLGWVRQVRHVPTIWVFFMLIWAPGTDEADEESPEVQIVHSLLSCMWVHCESLRQSVLLEYRGQNTEHNNNHNQNKGK